MQSRWMDIFSCIVGKTSTINVISNSSGGSKDGNMQLVRYCYFGGSRPFYKLLFLPVLQQRSENIVLQIQAEFQVPSALVPVRRVKFLRFCKQHAEGVWVMVDVSIDAIQEGPVPLDGSCRRLPSGCIVQELPNGCSKVTSPFTFFHLVFHAVLNKLLKFTQLIVLCRFTFPCWFVYVFLLNEGVSLVFLLTQAFLCTSYYMVFEC